MGNRTALWLSSNDLHIIYIRQMISFLENQPVVFAGKNIPRAIFDKSRGIFSNKISAAALKSFIQSSDFRNVGNALFSRIRKNNPKNPYKKRKNSGYPRLRCNLLLTIPNKNSIAFILTTLAIPRYNTKPIIIPINN